MDGNDNPPCLTAKKVDADVNKRTSQETQSKEVDRKVLRNPLA